MTREEIRAIRVALLAELDVLNTEGRDLDEAIRKIDSAVTPEVVLLDLLERLQRHADRIQECRDRIAIWTETEKAHLQSGR